MRACVWVGVCGCVGVRWGMGGGVGLVWARWQIYQVRSRMHSWGPVSSVVGELL